MDNKILIMLKHELFLQVRIDINKIVDYHSEFELDTTYPSLDTFSEKLNDLYDEMLGEVK